MTGGTGVLGEKVLMATGSAPMRPPAFAFETRGCGTPTRYCTSTSCRGSMVVVGGGVYRLRIRVLRSRPSASMSLIDGRPELLPFLDRDVCGSS